MSTPLFRHCQYLISSPDYQRCPEDIGLEVAFAGRSNAGKSSAINTLTGNPRLARTSKTPGRTQMLNFFSVSEQARIVDLPGYGYAKVPKAMVAAWQRELDAYLSQRKSLAGLILLMDIRHPFREVDTDLLNKALDANRKVHILLTKADKLKRGEAMNTLHKVDQHLAQFGADDLVSTQLFSSLKQTGIIELNRTLSLWLELIDVESSTQITP